MLKIAASRILTGATGVHSAWCVDVGRWRSFEWFLATHEFHGPPSHDGTTDSRLRRGLRSVAAKKLRRTATKEESVMGKNTQPRKLSNTEESDIDVASRLDGSFHINGVRFSRSPNRNGSTCQHARTAKRVQLS
jgi:hypothetical protein